MWKLLILYPWPIIPDKPAIWTDTLGKLFTEGKAFLSHRGNHAGRAVVTLQELTDLDPLPEGTEAQEGQITSSYQSL